MPQYSFCESSHAGPFSPWHIRKLKEAGRKLGGGADTPSLCGKKVAWDLKSEVTHIGRALAGGGHVCNECSEVYLDSLFPPCPPWEVK